MTLLPAAVAILALLLNFSVFMVLRKDRRHVREVEERDQAERVAGWVSVDARQHRLTAHIQNASDQPVYDVLFVVRDKEDLDFSMDTVGMLAVLPPKTIEDRDATFKGESFQSLNERLYLTFRDGRGVSWERDTHGRLRHAWRPLDSAPSPDGTTRRIPRIRGSLRDGDRPS